MMEILPKASIIIPVYNCGDTSAFRSLINVLKNQTEKNIEILLCDDGSTDKSVEICETISISDSRFITIINNHGGVSATRNSGLHYAKGEWITFIDADDLVTETFIEDFLRIANDNIDLIFGSYVIACQEPKIKLFKLEFYKGKNEVRGAIESTRLLERCSPWGKFFRKRIIDSFGLLFDLRLSHSEDRHFIYRYLQHIDSIATNPSIGYIYNSYSTSSLKHKLYPVDALILRQQLISDEAKAVCRAFELPYEMNSSLAINLIRLYCDAVYKMAQQSNGTQIIEDEKKFYTAIPYEDFKEFYFADERVKNIIYKDNAIVEILHGLFKQYNARQKRIQLKKKILSAVSMLLHRNKVKAEPFTQIIDQLN